MAKKPLILVVNDDGVTSHGIRTLIEVVKEFGDVLVVAPDSPQSGMGHAITIGDTLRLDPTDIFEGIEAYQCSGTPVDCVKIAKHYILKGKQPDLVVSGINHGSNSSINVLYSGTMSAAIEAAIEGIPSIGFSFCDYSPVADMSHLKKYVKEIVENVLTKGLPEGITLNVNFPVAAKGPIKGIKVCRQALSKWQEIFEERKDPHGRRYFWMTGQFENEDKGEDTDEFALANQYISIVPCFYDMTGHHAISKVNGIFAGEK